MHELWRDYLTGDFETSFRDNAHTFWQRGNVDALYFAGLSLLHMGQGEDGTILLRTVAAFRPMAPQYYQKAAQLYQQLGLLDLANEFLQGGQRDFPDDRDLRLAQAVQFSLSGQVEPAIALLRAMPQDADVLFMLALFLLNNGEYPEGWRLYGDRWEANSFHLRKRPPRQFRHLDQIDSKRIAVIREGGYGDLFLFLRYLPMLADRASEVLLHAHPNDWRLLSANLPANVTLVIAEPTAADLEIPPDIDLTTALMDLPMHFGTTLLTIPNLTPYISVPEAAVGRRKLTDAARLRVGLCWAGGASDGLWERTYDSRRSIALADLDGLQDIPDIEFISLQMGMRADDRGLPMTRVLAANADWLDTASIVAQLDLVITVDTSIAHLAAAMGKPIWLLSRTDACWRWKVGQQDCSPWYPNVRIFPQITFNDWSSAIKQVRAALSVLLSG